MEWSLEKNNNISQIFNEKNTSQIFNKIFGLENSIDKIKNLGNIYKKDDILIEFFYKELELSFYNMRDFIKYIEKVYKIEDYTLLFTDIITDIICDICENENLEKEEKVEKKKFLENIKNESMILLSILSIFPKSMDLFRYFLLYMFEIIPDDIKNLSFREINQKKCDGNLLDPITLEKLNKRMNILYILIILFIKSGDLSFILDGNIKKLDYPYDIIEEKNKDDICINITKEDWNEANNYFIEKSKNDEIIRGENQLNANFCIIS